MIFRRNTRIHIRADSGRLEQMGWLYIDGGTYTYMYIYIPGELSIGAVGVAAVYKP